MADPQSVWGIDVGKSALKAVKLHVGADKSVEVAACDYIEHAKIMSQQDADKKALWSAALEKFLSRNDISNDKVAVSVPGQITLARFSKLPPVENKKKIPDIIRYEADQQIPFDLDEVVWDYHQFQAPDSPEIEVGIFAIKRDLIRDHLLNFELNGIEPILVQSSPLAVYNAVLFDGLLADGPLILVDIGTENTDLLVATEHTLWTRTIPVGGNNFTEALVKAFKLSFGKAETLKRTAASSKYARQVFQAMRPVFFDLVQELQRSIGFFTATNRDVDLERVIGLGNAFKLPGLIKYMQQNLQIDVKRLDGFKKVGMPKLPDGGTESPANFAVAYGLGAQGVGQAQVVSSLLPPEIARQIVWRKKRPFFAAAAACLLLAAAAVWGRKMSDAGTLEANAGNPPPARMALDQATRIIQSPPTGRPPREYGATILAAAKTFQAEHRKLAGQGDAERQKIEAIAKLLDNRAVWIRLISAIHEALPSEPNELESAPDAKAYLAALRTGGTQLERSRRREIFIDSFDAVYLPNVDDEPIINQLTQKIEDPIESPGGGPRQGFIVTLKCVTPNEGKAIFVNRTFIKKLRDTGRRKGMGFYINRIGLNTEPSDRKKPPGRGRGRGGTGGTSAPVDESRDPLTGETLDRDFTFTIKMDVVLADLPEKPETKNPQSNQSNP